MPQVEFSKKDLEKLLGFKVNEKDLETYFLPTKSELDSYKDGIITLKGTDTNRPDLWGVEGVVRELKAHLDLETKKYEFKKSDYSVEISDLKNIRPRASYAIVKNVKMSEDFLVSLINMQEKIANSFGNRRKDVAIGIFDLDKIKGKKLKYFAKEKTFEFIPLGENKKMSLEQILNEHKKGIEYANLLKDFNKYPILMDEKENVLSMPPIINSNNSGKVELNTKNLFIDITGFSQKKLDVVLLIFAMAFVDRGCVVEQVEVNYLDEKIKYWGLDLTPGKMQIKKQLINEYIGLNLDDNTICKLLKQKNYSVEINKDIINLTYPPYRQDILHVVDVIEDIIIEYGYNLLEPKKLNFYSVGKLLPETEWQNLIRNIGVGLGLQEILSFTLTSVKKQYNCLNIKDFKPVELENPMSENIAIFRERILPEHLEFLSKNQHISYPQNIFEIGKVISIKDNKAIENTNLIITLSSNDVSYTLIKQYLDAVLKNLDISEISYEKIDLPYLIEGRSAKIVFKLNNKIMVGYLGEISPSVLMNFGINMPVAYFEININKYD